MSSSSNKAFADPSSHLGNEAAPVAWPRKEPAGDGGRSPIHNASSEPVLPPLDSHLQSSDSVGAAFSGSALQASPLEAGDAFASAVLRARNEGLTEGRQLEQTQQDALGKNYQQSLRHLATSIDKIAALDAALLEEARRQVLDLAVMLAHRLIGEELQISPERVLAMTEEVLAGLAPASSLCLRLHPEDRTTVESHRDRLIAAIPGLVKIELISDSSVDRGGCLIEQGHSVIDAQVQTRLKGLQDAIGSTSTPSQESE